jgi:hypothetical protein
VARYAVVKHDRAFATTFFASHAPSFSSIARSNQPFAFTPHVQLIPPPARRDVAAAIAARDGPDST